jgi:subtilisin family serine protease
MHPRRLLRLVRAATLTSLALASAWLSMPSSAAAQTVVASRVEGEVLVQLRRGDDLAAIQTRYRLSLLARFGARPIFRFRVPAGGSVDASVAALMADARVVHAEPNILTGAPEARVRTVWAVGTAGQFGSQWAAEALALPKAHAHATGAGQVVAVLDTGVDRSHPVLAGRLLPGHDFVDGDNDPSEAGAPGRGAWGHGTHVAGLVALAAPGAAILPLRVLDERGEGNLWVLAEALLHAVDPDGNPFSPDGARVINLSLGTLQRTDLLEVVTRLVQCDDDDDDDDEGEKTKDRFEDSGYQADRDRCNVLGSAVVMAAAGNGGSSTERQYPAAEAATGTLALAASNSAGRIADFSNRGSWVQLAAPGDAVISSVPGGGYGSWSGTSMAAPLAAGVAALLFERNPDWKPEDVTKRLTEKSVRLCGTTLRQLHAEAAVLDQERRGPRCR